MAGFDNQITVMMPKIDNESYSYKMKLILLSTITEDTVSVLLRLVNKYV